MIEHLFRYGCSSTSCKQHGNWKAYFPITVTETEEVPPIKQDLLDKRCQKCFSPVTIMHGEKVVRDGERT